MHKVSTATSIVVFFQFLGGSAFLAIAQNIFATHLVSELKAEAPALDSGLIIKAGAAAVRKVVRPEDLQMVLRAYDIAITDTFVSRHVDPSVIIAHGTDADIVRPRCWGSISFYCRVGASVEKRQGQRLYGEWMNFVILRVILDTTRN